MQRSLATTGVILLILGVLTVGPAFSGEDASGDGTTIRSQANQQQVYSGQAVTYAGEGMYSQYADPTMTPCESCGNCNCVHGSGLFPCSSKRCGRLYVDGWIAAGANSWNEHPITTNANLANDSDVSALQMNQLYLTLGREVVRGDSISVGGRVDLLYGTDYLYTSALGLETQNYRPYGEDYPATTVYAAKPRWNSNSMGGSPAYGLAMPQAYAEVYLPMMCGTSVKVGHFYSPLGYESVMNPSNFFYTHSYTMLYGEAKTLTGGIIEQQFNCNWSGMFGVTEAWDAFDAWDNAVSYVAGAKWESCSKNTSLAFTLMTGDNISGTDYYRGRVSSFSGTMTNYSLVFQQKLTPALQYVLQHDYGFQENGASGLTQHGKEYMDANWYSLVNYLYYQINDKLAIGGRFEWFKDKNHSRVLSTYVYDRFPILGIDNSWHGDNYYSASLGLNWKPTNWITVRPEVRWDWSDAEYVDNNTGQVLNHAYGQEYDKDSIFSVGGDVIVRF